MYNEASNIPIRKSNSSNSRSLKIKEIESKTKKVDDESPLPKTDDD